MKRIIIREHDRPLEDKGWLKVETCFDNCLLEDLKDQDLNLSVSLTEFCIKPNMGFVPHKHKNKDFIIIPLQGILFQQNSDGKEYLIINRDVHYMQTGAGITHYEYNSSFSDDLICLVFEITPGQLNLDPVCETIRYTHKENILAGIVSNIIQQNPKGPIKKVLTHWGYFCEKRVLKYRLKDPKNGVLLFMVKGTVKIKDITLVTRDTIVLWNLRSIHIITDIESDFILFEFPFIMN